MDDTWFSRHRPALLRGLFQAVLTAAIMLASLGGYLLVLKWRGSNPLFVTWTPLDDWLPWWPSFVWVYLAPYVIGPVLIGMLSPSTFWWYIRSGLIIVVVTLLIFVVCPTETDTEHRVWDAGTGLTADMYRHMTEIDTPPANAAPSLHVSLTCLLLLALLRDMPRWWPLWAGFVAVVWFSTLVTRQHHLIDVATGIGLSIVIALIAKPQAAITREAASG